MAEVEAPIRRTEEHRTIGGERNALPPRQAKTLTKVTASGSLAEAIGGVAAIALAIVGLAGVVPGYMVTIATIAVGVALLFQGTALAAEYSKLFAALGETTAQKVELGGGMGTQVLAGISGIVLGILGLIGIVPAILIPVAAIVLGTGLLLSTGATERLNSLKMEAVAPYMGGSSGTAQRVAHEMTSAANGAQLLIGLAAVVLGILALVGIAQGTLSLVAMLALGGSILLSGSAISFEMFSLFRRMR